LAVFFKAWDIFDLCIFKAILFHEHVLDI